MRSSSAIQVEPQLCTTFDAVSALRLVLSIRRQDCRPRGHHEARRALYHQRFFHAVPITIPFHPFPLLLFVKLCVLTATEPSR